MFGKGPDLYLNVRTRPDSERDRLKGLVACRESKQSAVGAGPKGAGVISI
jgi:hypothetical protein